MFYNNNNNNNNNNNEIVHGKKQVKSNLTFKKNNIHVSNNTPIISVKNRVYTHTHTLVY